MGYYINTNSKGEPLPPKGKAQALLADGATILPNNPGYQPNLVCIVDNGFFEAAGYCYQLGEYQAFINTPEDTRPRTWLLYPHAEKLSGYKP